MIGVGVADGTGFLSALLRKVAASTPKGLVTSVVVFLGIMSNIASFTGLAVQEIIGYRYTTRCTNRGNHDDSRC